MKAISTAMKRTALPALLLLFVLFATVNSANAQPPDCVSGTVTYAIFGDSLGSAPGPVLTLDSTEIRSVNILTGAVGPLMGGKRWWIVKNSTSGPATTYHGSAAMAVDFATNRFYLMTQMSNGRSQEKDIVSIDPVLGTQVVIASTPASLSNYHFVKMGAASNGWIYAIGVHRDTSTAASTFNPVIRFQTCGGAPTPGCATPTIELLGYLPNTSISYKWQLFNGDMAFANNGDLYYATAAFGVVSGTFVYTDTRLFRIAAADLPVAPGVGVIPMSLVADYNTLDSTALNGMSFSPSGVMYFSTRKFNGIQNAPGTTFSSQLYSSSVAGTATLMPAFVRPTPGTASADLGSCYFPAAVLAKNDVRLSGQYVSGNSSLKWEVSANNEVLYYEVQRSLDGTNFETIARVDVINAAQQEQKYSYTDVITEKSKTHFYRVRQMMNTGLRFYSNIIKLNGNKITLIEKIKPNPFISQLEIAVQLKLAGNIGVRITNQSGAMLYQRTFKGNTGANNIKISDIGNLKPGVYFIELSAGNEVIREKLVKQ